MNRGAVNRASIHTNALARGLLALGSVVLCGCATYEPQPLDTAAIEARWRSHDETGAVAAIQELVGPGTTPAGFDLRDGITLREAEAVALFFNPQLRQLRQQANIPVSGARFAGEWQDPELGIDGGFILSNVAHPLILGGTLSITIPLSGRPALTQRLAEAKSSLAAATVLGAEWAMLKELRDEWTAHAAHAAEIRLLEESIADLVPLTEASARFKAAQAMTVLEERLLLLQSATAEERRLAAAAQRDLHRLRIVALLGLHPAHPWTLTTEFPQLDETALRGAATNTAQAASHPALQTAMAAYAVAERAVELEIRRQYPDLQVGLGAGGEDGESRLLFGAGLLPIPVWNRNRAGIATSRAERTAAAVAVEAALQTRTHRVFAARTQHAGALRQLRFLEETVAPLADAQLKDARESLTLGSPNLLLLADAVEKSLTSRRSLVAARAAVVHAAIELYAATGPLGETAKLNGAQQ